MPYVEEKSFLHTTAHRITPTAAPLIQQKNSILEILFSRSVSTSNVSCSTSFFATLLLDRQIMPNTTDDAARSAEILKPTGDISSAESNHAQTVIIRNRCAFCVAYIFL